MSKTDELLQQKHLNDLKKEAVEIQNIFENTEELWKNMAEYSHFGPLKATAHDKEFVVEEGATYRQIVQAYFDQTQKYDEMPEDRLFTLLDQTKNIMPPRKKSYREAMEANLVLVATLKYPEDAEKISTLQLMSAHNYFAGLNNDAAAVIQPVLDKSVEKYLNGKETFSPMLQNYERIRLLHNYMFHSGQCDEKQVDKLLHNAEEKILKDPDMLAFATNHDLHVAYLLARKHENDDVLGKISQKIAKEKANSGNVKS